MSIVTLAYQLKVQRHAFFGAPTSLANNAQGEPRLMAGAMIFLAIGCIGLSALVVGGLENPYLVGPAADALLGGVFSL